MAILHPECKECGMKFEFDTGQERVKTHFESVDSMNVFCPYCGGRVATLRMEPTLIYPTEPSAPNYIKGLEALFG